MCPSLCHYVLEQNINSSRVVSGNKLDIVSCKVASDTIMKQQYLLKYKKFPVFFVITSEILLKNQQK